MNNFEKWKEQLTIEELITFDDRMNKKVISIDCINCPASDDCAFGQHVDGCIGTFKEWAEQEDEQ